MTRKASVDRIEALSDPTWLDALEAAHAVNQKEGVSTGLGCVMLDRWQDLRGRFGYRHLLDLRAQVAALAIDQLGAHAGVEAVNESGLIVRLPTAESLEDDCRALLERISSHDFAIGEESIALTVSMAAGLVEPVTEDVDAVLVRLVSEAEALRDHGGNQLVLAGNGSSEQADDAGTRKVLELLMQALRNDSVRVVFQPLLPTASEEVRSFQMLPRLRDETGGLIPAADFLPVARSADLLPALDRWMLTAAIQMLERRYRDQPIRLFLSQSEVLLADAERRRRLAGQLASATDLERRLVLDFRLTDAMAYLHGAEELIDLLQQAGVEVCFSMVDARSNWALLGQRLKCNYVRMAPDFVRALAASPTLERDLEALSAPARAARIKIILPMIEDADAAATLWRKGVDYLQGNLIQAAEETIQLTG